MPNSFLTPEEKAHLGALKRQDFQLAFLAVLTLKGVKPAGRWEKPSSSETIESLRGLGLSVQRIRRLTKSGREVLETIFAKDAGRLEEYRAHFDGRSIDKNEVTRRIEGLFFGYPSCCVEAFARKPYTANDLSREDQALLFHWACPGCRETPDLVKIYRDIHERLRRL